MQHRAAAEMWIQKDAKSCKNRQKVDIFRTCFIRSQHRKRIKCSVLHRHVLWINMIKKCNIFHEDKSRYIPESGWKVNKRWSKNTVFFVSPGGTWLQNWSAKRSDKSSLPFGTYNIYREGILTCPTPRAALYGGGGGHKVTADRSMHLIKMNKKDHIFWSFFIHFSTTLRYIFWLVLLKRWRYLIRHIMQSPLELIEKTSQKCTILEDFY